MTTKTKHSDGEWYAKDGQIVQSNTGRTLAVIPYFDSRNNEQKANQDLMAMAPTFLNVLTEVQHNIEEMMDGDAEINEGNFKSIINVIERAVNEYKHK